jgi:hypothetical protein
MASLLVISLSSVAARAEATVHQFVVLGDSQGQGIAGALQRAALRDRSYKVIDKTVPGTGICQKSQADWQADIDQATDGRHPDVAIVMLGTNDRLALRNEAGKALPFKSEGWRRLYGDRLGQILKSLAAAKVPVIWLGLPIVRDADYAGDLQVLNGLYEQAAGDAHAEYLPLWDAVVDEKGEYAAYGPGLDGQTKRMRQDDGIHFTPAGYDLIVANKLMPRIAGLLHAPQTAQSAVAPAAAAAAPAQAQP